MRAARRFVFPSQTSSIASPSSYSSSKTVFNEISNATRKSNIWWRGRSFAASVPSESSKTQKGHKKTSKEERRALIEAFIESYKASNGGKYPTPSTAQKQVGGSYYVVKKIFQEIEYQSKMSSTSKSSVSPLEKDVSKEEILPLPKMDDVSTFETTTPLTHFKQRPELKDDSQAIVANSTRDEVAIDNVETNEGSSTSDGKHLSRKASTTTIVSPGGHSSLIGTISHQTEAESKEVLHPYVEESKETNRVEAHFEGSVDLNCLETEVAPKAGHGTFKSDQFERDIHVEEDQLQKRSKVWGNLRSFADSFLNLWRKL